MVPEYYARLGVDPGAERAEIEAALKRMQPVWSMGTRNPKTRHANQLYLDEIPALRKALLSDPASRAAYDAELAMVQVAERERKLDLLLRRVNLRAAKGGLTATDRRLLSDEAANLGLSDEDLVRVTRTIPELVASEVVENHSELDDDAPGETLDPSTRRQIRSALEHLGCSDLYDALGASRDAPSSYIATRADAERQRWMKKAQVTAEKTAWLEVINHAQSHLTSGKARARYDSTLALEAEESFESLAEFAVKGLSRLDQGTRSLLIEEGARLGIISERADRLIGRICRRLNIARDRGTADLVAVQASISPPGAAAAHANGSAKLSLLRCRHCTGVTEMSPISRKSGTARCRHCGASLKWDCPVCKANLWVDERRCGCGFRQAFHDPLVRHFEAAQSAFRNFDLQRALEHLDRVQEIAPNLPGARSGVAKIRQRQADIGRVQLAFQTARAGGRLVSARAAIEAWSRMVDPASPEIHAAWADLSNALLRAEALATKARSLERTDAAAARYLYRQSLAIAADLPEAIAGLKRTPPDTATALDAQVLGDRIRLSWTPPPPDGLGPLTFVVVRKRGGALEHPGDGTRIAEVSTSEFDDMHVTPGDTVGYAVLSKRGSVESVAAISLGPFLFLEDAKDVRVEFRNREVELSWSLPRGVSEVRVIRKQGGPPKNPRDGDRVPAALDHALDCDLDPNEVYHYGIYAIYAMADGKLFPAPGVVVSARPQPPISTLEAPRLLVEPSGRVRIDWVEPARGSVKILRTTGLLPHAIGTRLSGRQTNALDGRWIEAAAPDRAIDPDPPSEGHCYYTPLVAWGDMATVGHSVAYSRVADPTELRATRSGQGLGSSTVGMRATLRWNWTGGADAMLIVARQGTAAQGPDDPAAITAVVNRDEYNRHECWTLNLPMTTRAAGSTEPPLPSPGDGSESAASNNGSWHIRVYGVVNLDAARLISPGLEPTAATVLPGPHPEVTVSYCLKRPWLPGLPWSLTLRTDPRGTAIPAMVLVAHQRVVPLCVDDGQIIARFPSGRDGAAFPVRIPSHIPRQHARVFPDPNVEPDAIAPIRLRHPETGKTRV